MRAQRPSMAVHDEDRSTPATKADLRAGLAEVKADIACLEAKLDAHISSTRLVLGLLIALQAMTAARLFGAL